MTIPLFTDQTTADEITGRLNSLINQINVAIATSMPIPTPVSITGSISPPAYDIKFSDYVASLTLQSDFQFGSAATAAGPHQIAIKNAADLAKYFNPYEDVDGLIRINGELEYYQPFESTDNFVFNANNLALTAVLRAGQHVTPTVVALCANPGPFCDGTTASTLDLFNLVTTAGIQVGQIVSLIFKGMYYVSALVDDTSITLKKLNADSSTTQNTQPFSAIFLPYYVVASTGTVSSSNQIIFAALPTGVAVGNALCTISSTSNSPAQSQDIYVTAIDGSGPYTVTVNQIISNSGSTQYVFLPYISSAQMWTKNRYGTGFQGDDVVAFELDCWIPNNGNNPFVKGQARLPTTFATVPATATAGAFPAFWMYSSVDPAPNTKYRNNAEIDFYEFYYSDTQDAHQWNHGEHPGYYPSGTTAIMVDTAANGGSTWQPSLILSMNVDQSLAPHKFGVIINRFTVSVYLDDILMRAYYFNWGDTSVPQIGIDMAVGSLGSSLGQNALFPYNDTNFTANYSITMTSLKFWSTVAMKPLPPIMQSAVCPSANPNTIILTFDQALDPAYPPDISCFYFYNNNSRPDALTSVQGVSGSTVTILKGVSQPGDVMTLSYYANLNPIPPKQAIVGTNGQPANSFFLITVTNNTVVTTNYLNLSVFLSTMVKTADGFGWDYVSSSGQSFNATYANSHAKIPAGQDGYVGGTCVAVTATGIWIGLTQNYGDSTQTSDYGIVQDTAVHTYYMTNASSNTGAPDHQITCLAGDIVRVRRAGTDIIGEVSQNGGTSYSPIKTWAGDAGLALYPVMACCNVTNMLKQPFGSTNVG